MQSTISLGATLLEWVQVVGTLGAVIAAVGIAYWGAHRERERRPVLSLAFDPELRPPDFMAGMGSGSDSEKLESHWVRLRVNNRKGRRSAEDVEVLFVGLEARAGTRPVKTLDVVPLQWSSTQSDTGLPLTRVTIPPGISRHVDLLAISGPEKNRQPDDKPIVSIRVSPSPTDDRHLLARGKYRFHLAVAARDFDAAHFRVDVDVPGDRLSEEDIKKHLAVSQPLEERPGDAWETTP